MRVLAVIPARWASTRFPGKPVVPLLGLPMIVHVWRRAVRAERVDSCVLATDDERIADVAREYGMEVAMTSDQCITGTDRVAEVARQIEADVYVNVQGDEPLIEPAVIDAVASGLADSEMTTAATPVNNISDYSDPNAVKVVVSAANRALYFSRRTIPFIRDLAEESPEQQLAAFPFLKHLGIYGYRRDTLKRLVEFAPSPLEQVERLEQLRALENGIGIAVCTVNYDAVGVDVPEDVQRVEALLRE